MSENQRTDRIEERLADLEKRCAMLERHYAPMEKDEPWFTLDAFLRLVQSPCDVCQYRLAYGSEDPCYNCLERMDYEWTYGDPMPPSFELHEALR